MGQISMTSGPAAAIATDILCCPIHREPLDFSDPAKLRGIDHGEVYPVIDQIPVLLPDKAERSHVAQTDWATFTGSSSIDFYNQTRDQDEYCRTQLEEVSADITRWLV